MNLKTLCRKMAFSKKKQYIIFGLCFIIGTLLFTSLGLLVFSKTISDNIVNGGSTQDIVYSLYLLTGIGCISFILYSHSLIIKHKSKDIGIFISLGLSRNNVIKIIITELNYILFFGFIISILLSLPLTIFIWNILDLFMNINIHYNVGWLGLLGGTILSIIITLLIHLKTYLYINKISILELLNEKHKIEDQALSNWKISIIGLIIIPTSIYLWDRSLRGLLFNGSSIASIIFALLVICGIYMVVSQISAIGIIIKKINKKQYYKNIIFYNIFNLRGKQYKNSLFTATLLISCTIFITCWAFVDIIANKEIIELAYPFDYTIRQSYDQNSSIDKDKIYTLAKQNNISIININEVDALILSYDKSFGNYLEKVPILCIDQNSYNKLFEENIELTQGYYNLYTNEKAVTQLDENKNIELNLIGSDIKIPMKLNNAFHKAIFSGYEDITYKVLVLNNEDYNDINKRCMPEAIERFMVFNVNNWNESVQFHNSLVKELVKENDQIRISGDLVSNIYYEYPNKYISCLNNSDFKKWTYKPYSKIYATYYSLKDNAIYSLLFIYITLLCGISSIMIIYIKTLNVSYQDYIIYKKIRLLGASKAYIKSIIAKQLLIIYMFPTIIGSITGGLIANAMRSQELYAKVFIKYSIIIVFLFIIIQIIMYLITKNRIIKNIDNLN